MLPNGEPFFHPNDNNCGVLFTHHDHDLAFGNIQQARFAGNKSNSYIDNEDLAL